MDDSTKEILANRDIAALRVTTADIKKRVFPNRKVN